jgi:hypothetical protein
MFGQSFVFGSIAGAAAPPLTAEYLVVAGGGGGGTAYANGNGTGGGGAGGYGSGSYTT